MLSVLLLPMGLRRRLSPGSPVPVVDTLHLLYSDFAGIHTASWGSFLPGVFNKVASEDNQFLTNEFWTKKKEEFSW